MAGQFSLIADAFKKSQNKKYTPGSANAKGSTAGASGSMGAKFFQARNSMASQQQESETLNNPIFKAFLKQITPMSPVTDYLQGK